MNALELSNVTKRYRLGQSLGLKEIFRRASNLFSEREEARSTFYALKDINFTVERGEVVGVIGANGSGKSTLLKLLSGITVPTRGTIKRNGSVAPLIEVGAGLHPELTGRENIFLNGAILGISRGTIRKQLDEIIDFAELDQFIDTPVKRYSSGMAIRLGFAVAVSVNPDILLVDEVLAVGDLAFQRKCFTRMEDLIRRQGKTVLIVSHNIRQVERMCSRVILLDHGRVEADGLPRETCRLYFAKSNQKIQSFTQGTSNATIHSSGEVDCLDLDILNEDGDPVNEITSGDPLRIRVRFSLNRPLIKPELVVGTHTTDFIYLSASSTAAIASRPDYGPGNHVIECTFIDFPVASGTYCVRVAIFDNNRRMIFYGETLKIFAVSQKMNEVFEAPLRTLNLKTEWAL